MQLQMAALTATDPTRVLEQLGWALVEKARDSYDPGYYKLAETCAECIQSRQPDNAEALLIGAHALMSMHRFRQAEHSARQLVSMRELYLDYGLLGDALMEQGRLGEAVETYQRMMDLKPGPHSYTRAAHMRWLKGDLDGALEMMRLAVNATGPNQSESAAWNYSRLAMYELQAGALSLALESSVAALELKPDYPPALLARGRVLLAEKKYDEAAECLIPATRKNPLPEYQWALAEALIAAGRRDEASSVETELKRRGEANDRRTFALYLASRRESPERAVALADEELGERADVFSLDAGAWALASVGRTREARELMNRAVAEGTIDARLFYHAGAIAAMTGDRREAKVWLARADRIKQMLLPSERDELFLLATELRTKTTFVRADGRASAP